ISASKHSAASSGPFIYVKWSVKAFRNVLNSSCNGTSFSYCLIQCRALTHQTLSCHHRVQPALCFIYVRNRGPIVATKPEGRRKRGRQRLRWMDDEEEDLRLMEVKSGNVRKIGTTSWAYSSSIRVTIRPTITRKLSKNGLKHDSNASSTFKGLPDFQ
ncbi:hypothetical protein L9F63_006602, partial [Diploptera punctata]